MTWFQDLFRQLFFCGNSRNSQAYNSGHFSLLLLFIYLFSHHILFLLPRPILHVKFQLRNFKLGHQDDAWVKSITLEPTSVSPSCVTLSSYSVASFSCLCQRVYDGTSRGTWRAEWDWHLLHPGSSSFHCYPDSREKDFFFFFWEKDFNTADLRSSRPSPLILILRRKFPVKYMEMKWGRGMFKSPSVAALRFQKSIPFYKTCVITCWMWDQ